MRTFTAMMLIVLCAACATEAPPDFTDKLDSIAEQYVRLGLALGEHDSDYVDAYFGPPEWREEAADQARTLVDIVVAADELIVRLGALDARSAETLLALRHNYLLTHLRSLATVSRVRDGLILSFDEESELMYGFVAPSFPAEHYDKALQQLGELLPGQGAIHERFRAFREQYRIPDDKVKEIIRKGLDICRERTRQHMALPDGEDFALEFVSGEPWGAYNWYLGKGQGLIQVNLGRPKYLGASIRLGCHEGYPGHHAFSALLEERYLNGLGWIEFSLLPLFSPQGIIFEGSGNLASAVAFPGSERTEFLRDVIAPIAGLEAADLEAAQYIRAATHDLRYAGIEAARHYLDGDWSKAQTIEWLTTYALVGPESIDAWFAFTARYRAYRINYVLGEDLVEGFVRARNPDRDPAGDWLAFAELLSLPPTPALFAPEN